MQINLAFTSQSTRCSAISKRSFQLRRMSMLAEVREQSHQSKLMQVEVRRQQRKLVSQSTGENLLGHFQALRTGL
jgi:hypothetical protein